MEKRIFDLILKAVSDLNEDLERKVPLEMGKDAPLYGNQGVLDSLGLVTLVVSIEQAIQDELGVTVALADEKALSLTRSPFKTIGTLTEYAARLVPER
jgi:acyl carrier protein